MFCVWERLFCERLTNMGASESTAAHRESHKQLVSMGVPVVCAGVMMGTPAEVAALLGLWADRYAAMVDDGSLPCRVPGRTRNKNLVDLAALSATRAAHDFESSRRYRGR